MSEAGYLEGTVIRVHAKHCVVDRKGEPMRCVLRGRFFEGLDRKTRPVAVGDRVRFRVTAEEEGAIEEVLERRSKLSRPGVEKGGREQVIAANVDQVVVVAAVRNPPFRPGLVDRILVAARAGGLDPVFCLNKCDEGSPAEIEAIFDSYRGSGTRYLLASALTGEGIGELRDVLTGKTSVLSGPSGAGKSSLINAVQPGLSLRVSQLGRKSRRGRHTTTAVSLLRLDFGGYVVDTPGVREFGLWEVTRADLDLFFPEIARYFGTCHFRRCSHVHEPGCAVKQAVEAGEIRKARYESYARILESLE